MSNKKKSPIGSRFSRYRKPDNYAKPNSIYDKAGGKEKS